jgi:tripartite-type tricarboxylate transporter receptor subunit TctC
MVATKFVAVNESGADAAPQDVMAAMPPEVAQRNGRHLVRRLLRSAAVAVICALAITQAIAQAAAQPGAPPISPGWPNKPVRIVVPWPPGGSADLIGRILAEHLGNAFAQSFLVENRPGASGMVGSAAVAHADPDGATFVISGIPSHVIAPATSANAPFDPLKDFTHIAYIGGSPIVVTAHASLGATTLSRFVALARGDGNAIGYVSPGVGSLGHMVGEYIARKDGIRLEHIPYKGGVQAVTDLVAGHVKVGAMTLTTSSPHIRAGTLAALALSSSARLASYPDLPTLKELGYSELVTTTWWSVSGPAKLPADLVRRLNLEINKVLDLADVRRKLEQEAIVTEKMSSAEFTRFLASEIDKWGPPARSAISAQGSAN